MPIIFSPPSIQNNKNDYLIPPPNFLALSAIASSAGTASSTAAEMAVAVAPNASRVSAVAAAVRTSERGSAQTRRSAERTPW